LVSMQGLLRPSPNSLPPAQARASSVWCVVESLGGRPTLHRSGEAAGFPFRGDQIPKTELRIPPSPPPGRNLEQQELAALNCAASSRLLRMPPSTAGGRSPHRPSWLLLSPQRSSARRRSRCRVAHCDSELTTGNEARTRSAARRVSRRCRSRPATARSGRSWSDPNPPDTPRSDRTTAPTSVPRRLAGRPGCRSRQPLTALRRSPGPAHRRTRPHRSFAPQPAGPRHQPSGPSPPPPSPTEYAPSCPHPSVERPCTDYL